jgi:hypothetical protein
MGMIRHSETKEKVFAFNSSILLIESTSIFSELSVEVLLELFSVVVSVVFF